MLITKEIEIDMGHRVPNHKSKCSNLHGHRYKIEVGVDDKVIQIKGSSSEGMVIDFGDLKEVMMSRIDFYYDHGFIMSIDDPLHDTFDSIREDMIMKIILVDFIPTAENLAKHWFEVLEDDLRDRKIKLQHVKVWETPTSTAIYTSDDKE